MRQKRDNISGVVLGTICLLYAGMCGYSVLKSHDPISRSVISNTLHSISFLYIAVLSFLCCKKTPFYIWVILKFICNYYTLAIGFSFTSYTQQYEVKEIPKLIGFASEPRLLITGLILNLPEIIYLILALWGVRKNDGKVKFFAKILWYIPFILTLLFSMPYIAYDSARISHHAEMMRTQPLNFLLVYLLPTLLRITISILMGYWLLFSGKIGDGYEQHNLKNDCLTPEKAGECVLGKICSKCGNNLPEDALFCIYCGSAIDETDHNSGNKIGEMTAIVNEFLPDAFGGNSNDDDEAVIQHNSIEKKDSVDVKDIVSTHEYRECENSNNDNAQNTFVDRRVQSVENLEQVEVGSDYFGNIDTEPAIALVYCVKCGYCLDSDDVFCPVCGTKK